MLWNENDFKYAPHFFYKNADLATQPNKTQGRVRVLLSVLTKYTLKQM